MQNFTKYIEICETLARSATSKGNSAVGSLIILDNKIIAQAEEAVSTKQDVSFHAEMEVIRRARKKIGLDMTGAILISTKEPCVMCSYAIRYHKISTVVYRERASWLGGYSSSFNVLTTNAVSPEWGPAVNCIEYKP